MKFKRSSTKEIFTIGVIVLALFATGDTCASPLYGGYNGESEAWIEVYIIEKTTIGFSSKISVGIDPDLNVFWIRIGISSLFLLPSNISHIGFSYETGDIVSGDIVSASITTILPPIKWGFDTNNLQWFITNWLIAVSGLDSDGNVWGERRIPGMGACGWDSNNDKWCWIKFFPVLVGWRVELTSNQGTSLNQENALRFEKELRPLQDHFAKACNPKLSALLIERLTDDEIMDNMINLLEALNDRIALLPLTTLSIVENREGFPPIDPSSKMPSELKALLTYVEKNIFTDEVRDEVSILLDTFAKDIQPRLKALRKIGTAP